MSEFTNTNTNTNNFLDSAVISFDNEDNECNKDNEDINNKKLEVHFGTLDIKAQTLSNPLIEHLKLYLNIDISGSMSDYCKDKKSKMEHIQTIIKNLLRELYKFKDQSIAIIVNGFESNIHKILDIKCLKDLTELQMDKDIIPKINKLQPLNSTNIEKALKTAAANMDTNTNTNTNVHILLTDGNATEGNTNPDILKTFMPKTCTNIILGIGIDYDARALKTISSNQEASFKHINEAETAGLCVGEIIHSLLYETLKDLRITIENGEIYNYITGQWGNALQVDSIASEQTKTYHIRATNQNKVLVNLDWTTNKIPFQYTCSEFVNKDLTRYKFRQEVLELLHIASENSKKMDTNNNNNINTNTNLNLDLDFYSQDYDLKLELDEKTKLYYEKKQEELKEQKVELSRQKEEQNKIKQQLKTQLIKMMCYMDENQLQSDIFYIMLCSDLKVVLDSLGRRNAELYITSRLTSQGRQETYTCDPDANESYIEEDINELDLDLDLDLNLEDGRYNRMTLQINSNSNNLKSPYATPQQVGLMRGISSRPVPKELDFYLSESEDDESKDKEDEL
jgi:hypothetical protein